ncbi:MAG: peptidoglycan-binding protein [Bacillota bacterium]|nr:peptidoglycan-binding protein [Bacillota bacterium]
MNKKFKRTISILLVSLILSAIIVMQIPVASASSSTGVGLAAFAMKAYNDGWSYVYGSCTSGAVDCSGLIKLYNGVGGSRTDMLGSSPESGNVSDGIPRIQGLGLHKPGHVGVYVGNGMAVDARDEQSGVCYSPISRENWVEWFKVAGVSYPTNGWVLFNGNSYYYEDGQYVVSTSETLDDITYNFNSSGVSDKSPGSSAYEATDYSSVSAPVAKSVSKASDSSTSTGSSSNSGVLKVGSSGDDVTKLQNRLTALGFYSGPISGYFGDQTESAYKDFQRAANVTVDGIAGASDLKILYSDSAPKKAAQTVATQPATTSANTEYKIGDSGDTILQLQTKLKDLGYFNDTPTGYFGELTAAAVTTFQAANKLTQTGYADTATQKMLNSGTAVKNPNSAPTVPATTTATQSATSASSEPETNTASNVKTQTGALNTALATKVSTQTSNAVATVAATDTNNGAVQTGEKFNSILWIIISLAATFITFFIVYAREKRKLYTHRTRAKVYNSRRRW